VQNKSGDDWTVLDASGKWQRKLAGLRAPLDRLSLWRQRHRGLPLFSTSWLPDGLKKRVESTTPDIVHLHWINAGFMRLETLSAIRQPMVWTLHDMWAFTGGCHYAGDCRGFENQCGACPVLGSTQKNDLSRQVWTRKTRAWKHLDLTLVTPSRWMADEARASALFRDRRIEVIANGLDLDRFRPVDRAVAREILGLPQDARLVLFGAMDSTSDKRKGFHLLEPALQKLGNRPQTCRTELVIFGASEPRVSPDLPMKAHYLGTLADDISLALAYSCADVFVAPSLQDNLPNTVAEALACGVPVVSFDVGGLPDMIDHKKNGYLARPFEADDLAHGIDWVLANENRQADLARAARAKAEEEYGIERCVQQYVDLYTDVTSKTQTPLDVSEAVTTP
jgi:glycosyltransferase involved in cell wall biosynthesis